MYLEWVYYTVFEGRILSQSPPLMHILAQREH
jgi:hypothetical protein